MIKIFLPLGHIRYSYSAAILFSILAILNLVIGAAVVVIQAFTLVLLVCLFSPYESAWMRSFRIRVAEHALELALFVGACGAILTFVYYYGEGFVPCDLAWYQHICLYPLVALLAFRLFGREPFPTRFALLLSGVGLVLSCLHVLIEYGVLSPALVGGAVSCAADEVRVFGYLTIPLMAFTGFLLITTLVYISRERE